MAASFDIVAKLRADTKDFITGLKSGEGATKSFSTQMGEMSKVVVLGGVALAAVGGAALYKLGSTFDEAFDNIRVGTGATGDALVGLQNDMKAVAGAVPASFNDASTAISGFSTRLGLTGAPLQTLSSQVLELSRITDTDLKGNIDAVSQVMQNFGVDSTQQSGKLDLLFRASQASGLSVAELANTMSGAGVVLRSVGFSFDQTVGLMTSLKKAGVDASDVMPALGKTLASAAKNGKDASTVFNETFNAIKGAPNDVAASATALEVFGAKAGPKLAAMIREGKFSFEEMTAALAGGGETIMGASEDTQDFSEKLTLLKNRVFLALEPIATKVFNKIGELMDTLGPKVEQLTAWMTENGDTMKILAGIVAGVVVVAIGGYIVAQIGAFAATVAAAGGLVAYTGAALAAAAATIAAAAPFILVAVLIAALVAGVIYAYKNFETFRNVVDAAWQGIQKAISFAWENVIKPIWNLILFYIQNILIPYVTLLFNVYKKAFEIIMTVISFAWNNVIKPIWNLILFYIQNILIPYVTLLFNAYKTAFEIIMTVIDFAWNYVIKPIWDMIVFYITNILIPYYKMLWEIVKTVFGAIVGAIQSAWGFMSGIFENIKNGIGGVAGFIKEKIDAVVGFFTGLPGRIGSIGSSIADAIGNAFKGAWNFIADIINDLIPDQVGFSVGPSIDLPDNPVPKFYKGGMVQDGLFSVGERGPELGIKQGSSVRIFSNAQSNQMMQPFMSSQSSGDVYVTVNGSNVSPQDVGREVLWALKVAG
jgi:TP901 family phage tail tape measure protein